MDSPNRNVVLKPYTQHPASGWRRLRGPALVILVVAFCFIYGFGFALTAPFLLLQFGAPLAVLAGVAIWALPDSKKEATNALPIFFFAFYIALLLWPNYLAVGLPGMPWITLLRLTGFPLLFLLLLRLSTSPEFRMDMVEVLRPTPILWKMFLGFVIIQFITIALSGSISFSLNKFIVAQISWTAIFFASCYIFLTPGRVQIWAAMLWIMIIAIGLIGIQEHMHSKVLWAGHIPNFLKIEDEAVQNILSGASRAAVGAHRVQSTSTTPLGLAELIALAIPFILHFMVSTYPIVVRIAALVSIPLCLYVVFLTDSRLGVVGFFLSILFYLLLWASQRWKRLRDSIIAPAITLSYPALFAAFLAATFLVGRLRAKVWGNGPQQYSDAGRQAQYEDGIRIILSNPFGHGAGRGAEVLGHANQAGTLTIDAYYLSIGLEYGIVGLILYYGIISISIVNAAKYTMRIPEDKQELSFLLPISISLTNFFVIKSIFSQEANHPLAFMMMGMVVALGYRLRSHERQREKVADRAT